MLRRCMHAMCVCVLCASDLPLFHFDVFLLGSRLWLLIRVVLIRAFGTYGTEWNSSKSEQR